MLEMLSSQPPAAARQDPEGDREGERQDLGDHEELDGHGQALRQRRGDGFMRVVRLAEVPLQHLPEPLDVALGRGWFKWSSAVTWAMPVAVAVGAEHRHATLPGSRFQSRYERRLTTRRTRRSCTNLRRVGPYVEVYPLRVVQRLGKNTPR